MDQARVLRVLQDGGMVVLRDGRGALYRGRDLRRSEIGFLDVGRVRELLSESVLCHQGSDTSRLIWAGRKVSVQNYQKMGPPRAAFVCAAKPSARSALEHILRAETDNARQRYLAHAASRFGQDVESAYRGQAVTMSWEFVPRGKTGTQPGCSGIGGAGLGVSRRMSQLARRLGERDMALLRALIISEHPIKRVMLDFDISRAKFATEGIRILTELAEAYDRVVTPERH